MTNGRTRKTDAPKGDEIGASEVTAVRNSDTDGGTTVSDSAVVAATAIDVCAKPTIVLTDLKGRGNDNESAG